MIYKNGIKVNKIEVIIDDGFICHLHLSNGEVYSLKPKQVDPSIMHNQNKLENFTVLAIAKTLDNLKKEMKDD